MSNEGLTRRTFLRSASAGAAVIGTQAWRAHAGTGANERLSIGMIGVGDRGNQLIGELLPIAEQHNAEITAICDVWRPNLEKTAERIKKHFGKEPRSFTRFGELIALADVDAVMIATPDVSHCRILIDALNANKDAYIEKPMSMFADEANQALDLARAKNRVVQVGTQRRSMGNFKAAASLFATGVLGKLNRVSAAINVNAPRWARPFDNCKAEDVDWDAFLFNVEKQPFDPKLLRRWHLYKLLTTGIPGLWMPHHADGLNMVVGCTYPTSVVAHGGRYVWKEDREHDDTFQTLVDYPEGFLFSWQMGLGNSAGTHWDLYGTEGTMDIEKFTITSAGSARPKARKQQGEGAATRPAGSDLEKIQPEPSESHVGNWLECLRSRKRPNADIECGHQHAITVLMAAAARETGRKQVYDPAKREFHSV